MQTLAEIGVDAKIALVGPRGGGKTMLRLFLRHGAPNWVPHSVLRALKLARGRAGQRSNHEDIRQERLFWVPPAVSRGDDDDGDTTGGHLEPGWHREDLPLQEDEYRVFEGTQFVEKVAGTTFPILHTLPLQHGQPNQVLDFPGEYFLLRDRPSSDAQRIGPPKSQSGSDEVLSALRNCRLLVMVVPYWLMIPSRLRNLVPGYIERLNEHGHAPHVVGEQGRAARELREDLMAQSLGRWLSELAGQLDDPVKENRPLILVSFSMLSSRWEEDLKDDPVLEEVRRHLAEMHRLMRLSDEIAAVNRGDGWLRFGDLAITGRLRRVVKSLDKTCAQFVTASDQLWKRTGQKLAAINGLIRRIGDPSQDFRLMAMNVVDEGCMYLQDPGDGEELNEFLHEEASGIQTLLLYLATALGRH